MNTFGRKQLGLMIAFGFNERFPFEESFVEKKNRNKALI